MKIAFISDQFYPRTSADAEQIVSSLSALGKIADTTLISAAYQTKETTKQELAEYYQKEITFNLFFVKHAFKNIRGIEKISFAIRSRYFLKKLKYDLVYTRNIPVLISVLLFTKYPILFESYRPWPNRNWLAKVLFTYLAKKERVLGVILHSKFAGVSFNKVGFSDKKLKVAHNAFSMSNYKVASRTEILSKYKIPVDRAIITYSGRVSTNKGVDRIFKLAGVFHQVNFVIIGSEKEGEIEKRAKDFSNVYIIKWIPKKEVFSLLAASDILYIPPTRTARDKARNTVLPLKTFLYKAAGKAILAPDMEDIKEILRHSENAFLVEPDNDDLEILAIKELLEDTSLRKKLGATAKEEMKFLTWDKRAEKILKFVKEKLK